MAVLVAVALLALFWAVSVGLATWGLIIGRPHQQGRGGDIAWIVLWTLAVVLLLWRVWRGGPKAIVVAAAFGRVLGLVMLLGTAVFVVLYFVQPEGPFLGFLPYLLPGLLGGGALFTAGRLLGGADVREWAPGVASARPFRGSWRW